MAGKSGGVSDPLFSPYRLKHLTLKNRIISTAHEPAYTENGRAGERYRLYHLEKAKGGLAMTMIAGSAVIARDSPQAFGNLRVDQDEAIADFRAIARAVHAEDCAIMAQITHLGRRTHWHKEDWLPVISASPIREPAHRAFPRAMEDFDIRRIVAAYGQAARRCREGELDGIEIEAYGHLFDSFWSPRTNRRTDEYGGSFANRLRFAEEVLREIRRAAGADFLIGLRMAIDDKAEGGIGEAEGIAIARHLRDAGLVDFVNVIVGLIESDLELTRVIPGMGTPAGPNFAIVKRAREALFPLPILHAARINDPATARHWLEAGAVDLIGMTRAHMADPHIAAKIARGEETRIRPCVGAGYCIDRIYQGGEALCLHNPATGREAKIPHIVPKSPDPGKRILVIGAGPAGLEGARVSALRGHRVSVIEAASRPGGQIVLAAQAPRRRELIGIVDWLYREAELAGAEFRFDHLAEAADILAAEPDIVILATGGLPNPGEIAAGGEFLTTGWDILAGQVAIAPQVILYDDEGGHEGLSTAEFVAASGAKLEIATPERMIGIDAGGLNYPGYYRSLYAAGVGMLVDRRLRRIERIGNRLRAEFVNDYTGRSEWREADQIIGIHASLPNDALYTELKEKSLNRGEIDLDALVDLKPQNLTGNPAGRFRLFRVGDALAARNIHAAIYDSLRLALAL